MRGGLIKKHFFFFTSCYPFLLFGLPQEPWLGNVYEFFFDAHYTFSFYTHVANGRPSTKHSSYDHQFLGGIGFTPSQYWDLDLEVEVTNTTTLSWNLRSVALQGRYLWLDDVIGDPISLTTGLSLRGVPHRNLRDTSCPYPGEADIELSLCAGKEWSTGPFWTARVYGLGAVGIANRGSPWTRLFCALEGNYDDRHQFQLSARGEFGFGAENFVNVDHFRGYGNIHHQSVDLGAAYRYQFLVWGRLSFEYVYRIYAHAYPERVNYFTLWYHLPFSLF